MSHKLQRAASLMRAEARERIEHETSEAAVAARSRRHSVKTELDKILGACRVANAVAAFKGLGGQDRSVLSLEPSRRPSPPGQGCDGSPNGTPAHHVDAAVEAAAEAAVARVRGRLRGAALVAGSVAELARRGGDAEMAREGSAADVI